MNVIQELVVSLGWSVDAASQQRARRALQQIAEEVQKGSEAEKRATQEVEREFRRRSEAAERMGRDIGVALGRTIGGAVSQLIGMAATLGGAFASVRLFNNMVSDLKALQDESLRTGASVRNIQALQYAFEKIGSSGDQALGAINSIASALRENRGNRTFLAAFNIGPEVTDTVTMLEKMSEKLKSMESDTALAYGRVLGLTDEMVRALRLPRFPEALAEARRIQQEWGVDLEEMAKRARRLTDEYNRLSLQASYLRIQVLEGLLQVAGPFVQGINDTLQKNAGAISGALNDVSGAIRNWSGAASQQILDWFQELFDPKNADMRQGWVTWANDFKEASTGAASAIKDIAHTLQTAVEFAQELWRVMNATADFLAGRGWGSGFQRQGAGGFDPSKLAGDQMGIPGMPDFSRKQAETAEKQADSVKKFSDAIDEDKRAREQDRSSGGFWSKFKDFFGNMMGVGGGGGAGGGGGGGETGAGGDGGTGTDAGGAGGEGGGSRSIRRGGQTGARERTGGSKWNPTAAGQPGQYRPAYSLGPKDLSDAVVNTIAGEAVASNPESVDAVINNMMNRVGSKGWGPSGNLEQVARARGQYAGYRQARPEEAERIRARIRAIASGGVPDNTAGANTYRAAWYGTGGSSPWFNRIGRTGRVVGGNRFAFDPSVSNGPYAPFSPGGGGASRTAGAAAAAVGLTRNVDALIGDRAAAMQAANGAAAVGAENGPLGGDAAPLATPANTDNSRSVNQTNSYNTTITATDPAAAASAWRRASQINAGETLGQITGAIR